MIGPQIMTWTSGILPPGTPAVAATSRGLRYGDGVFVTLRIRSGVLLDAELQMSRLLEAAGAIGLAAPARFETPFSAAATLATIVADMDPTTTDGVARMQWFAGAGPRGFGRETMRAEVLVDLTPGPDPRNPSIVVLPGGHVPLPALPRYKTCSSLANILCAREALRLGVDAAVRVESGAVLETASENLFWIRDEILFTPACSLPLYPGSVRERILECAPAVGLDVEDGEFGVDAVVTALTVFLANAVRGIELVCSVDGRAMDPPPPILTELRIAVEERRIERGTPLNPGAADADA